MTYEKISHMYTINDVDGDKVRKMVESMKENGYIGCPILIFNDELLTGSHRLSALKQLEDDGFDIYNWEVAEDVTDLVNEAFEKFEDEYGWSRDLDYSDLGWMFKGTWVENYKDEIEEW